MLTLNIYCSPARANAVSDWDLHYEFGLEIPTELNSLGALTRCDFGPLLSAYFRFEQKFQKTTNDPRFDFYLPFRLPLSSSATAYLGPGMSYWGSQGSFSTVVGFEVAPIVQTLVRTELYTGLGSSQARLVFSQAASWILPSSAVRQDYLGLRFEVQRAGAFRDSRFLIATGSQF